MRICIHNYKLLRERKLKYLEDEIFISTYICGKCDRVKTITRSKVWSDIKGGYVYKKVSLRKRLSDRFDDFIKNNEMRKDFKLWIKKYL